MAIWPAGGEQLESGTRLAARLPNSVRTDMEAEEPFSVIRTIAAHRPTTGRWEVYDAAGRLVGVVAEVPHRNQRTATFTVVYNPTGTPFRPPPGRRLRALGVWCSGGHATVPAAVAALARYFAGSDPAA